MRGNSTSKTLPRGRVIIATVATPLAGEVTEMTFLPDPNSGFSKPEITAEITARLEAGATVVATLGRTTVAAGGVYGKVNPSRAPETARALATRLRAR